MSRLPESAVLPVRVFFLCCVMIAGIYGARTISPNTLIIQTAFAAVALVLVWLSRSPRSGAL
jgi:putative membrane protein